MAENETKKEKVKISMNVWFIVFLVYLVFTLAFGYSLIQENRTLKVTLAEKENAMADLKNTSQTDINKLLATIDNVSNLLAEAKNEIVGSEVETPTTIEITTGTYNGSTESVSMTLTLSENNIATLSIVNESGDSLMNGTYSLAENSVVFSSNDGATYTFTAVDNSSLTIVDNNVELTLSK